MKFGVINPWPNQLTAEAEFIFRLEASLSFLGHTCIVLDPDGNILNRKPSHDDNNQNLQPDAIFVFDPRFINFLPKCIVVSPLWIPPELLSVEQRSFFFESLPRIDLFIGGYNSAMLVETYARGLQKFGRSISNPKPFCASVPSIFSVRPRKLNCRTVFYAGVNAERIKHSSQGTITRPGRYSELFKKLDKFDYVNFYGPKSFGEIEPWSGYKSYSGEIPLDGKSVINVIAKHGIALCFNSPAHAKYGIANSRIFEAAAAGAVIISDDNKFTREAFGDSVFYVDITCSETAANQISYLVSHINGDEKLAINMARQAQDIFLRTFSLESQCNNAISAISQFRSADYSKQILLICTQDQISAALHTIKRYNLHPVAAVIDEGKDHESIARAIYFKNISAVIAYAKEAGLPYLIALPTWYTWTDGFINRMTLGAMGHCRDAAVIIASHARLKQCGYPNAEAAAIRAFDTLRPGIDFAAIVADLTAPGFSLFKTECVGKLDNLSSATDLADWVRRVIVTFARKGDVKAVPYVELPINLDEDAQRRRLERASVLASEQPCSTSITHEESYVCSYILLNEHGNNNLMPSVHKAIKEHSIALEEHARYIEDIGKATHIILNERGNNSLMPAVHKAIKEHSIALDEHARYIEDIGKATQTHASHLARISRVVRIVQMIFKFPVISIRKILVPKR